MPRSPDDETLRFPTNLDRAGIEARLIEVRENARRFGMVEIVRLFENLGSMSAAQQQALAALQSRNVVFFEFDSSEIRADYLSVVAAHAAYLTKFPTARVRLEGHTDERGSREYNIGLGERRAQTVRKALMLQGVSEAQITTVSYGEERPAVEGSDESAHAQNRRVELVQVQ